MVSVPPKHLPSEDVIMKDSTTSSASSTGAKVDLAVLDEEPDLPGDSDGSDTVKA